MAVTIRDIAERLNLSKSTVSYALNDGPKPVSEEVKRRVAEAAAEMGFRRNEVARSLAVGRTHTIGFVPLSLDPQALSGYYGRKALEALYLAAERHGLHILLPTGYSPADPRSTRDRLFAARVDGFVLLLPSEDPEMLSYLRERSLPTASISSTNFGLSPYFNMDNRGGTYLAVDHLVDLGHRKIALLGADLREDVRERRQAFEERMAHHGLPVRPEYLENGDLVPGKGFEAGLRLLGVSDPPTAVYCLNDAMAFGLIGAARQLGLDIPRDLSIVGFDDDDLSAVVSPPLTTIYQPIAEMATTAFNAVVDLIAGKPVENVLFPARLIVRASTATPLGKSRNTI